MATARPTAELVGRVTQVIGSTFDAEFADDHLPAIYNALKIDTKHRGIEIHLTGEVQQHLGGNRVRCVAIGSTDGLMQGNSVVDTGGPVTVPVGKETLGRVCNLLGERIDGRGPVEAKERWAIHRKPPEFSTLSAKTELFETGIKVIDLLTPIVRGGKAGLFGGAGLGRQGRAEQPQEWQRSRMTIRQSIVAIMLALLFAGFLVVRLLIGNGVIGVMTGWKLYALLFVVTSLVGLLSISRGGPSR